jgi:glycosyltransferase involved in cell wall biosynthesis
MTTPVTAYFEVSPLFEMHWTGIPAVTAGLAYEAIEDRDIEWKFLYENILLERGLIQELMQRRGGDYLRFLEQQLFDKQVLAPEDAASSVCLYPNVKALRRVFKREALILHDFSTLLTPEFHNRDTINHHANRIRGDIESSDCFFCVSKATRGDLIHYFGVPESSAKVLPLGISIDPCAVTACVREGIRETSEPYVCVLGTVEPRKNGQLVLELLQKYPEFLSKYQVVFIGREGWNNEKGKLNDILAKNGIDIGRITFTGFVNEATKIRLIMGSRYCIYPSFFEGYGIPVAEAAALGKFVVCSNSSSIIEVAPDMSLFFDPTDVESLAAACQKAEEAVALTRLNQMKFPGIWDRVNERSWKKAYALVKEWVNSGY